MSAARKGAYDVAIGGVIGSNLFNLLAVGGAIGLSGGTDFSSELLGISLPTMVAASLLIGVIILKGWRLGRLAGAVFVMAYCGYILFLAHAGRLF